MINAWWLIPAAMVGALFGIAGMCLAKAAKERDESCGS